MSLTEIEFLAWVFHINPKLGKAKKILGIDSDFGKKKSIKIIFSIMVLCLSLSFFQKSPISKPTLEAP